MAVQHGVRRVEHFDEARRERHPALIVPATHEHMELQRDVWRPLLRGLDEPDAEWPWLAEFIEGEEHSLEWEAYALIEPGGLLHGLISICPWPDVLYVERLGVAPWNREGSVPRQRLGCGTKLLIHAMRKSVTKGYGGRIALHSLPGSLKFYRERIKMTHVRMEMTDEGYLPLLELSDNRALEWIEDDGP